MVVQIKSSQATYVNEKYPARNPVSFRPHIRATSGRRRCLSGRRYLKLMPKRMQEFVDRGDISGVVTLVGRNGRIDALDAAGFADIENKRGMQPMRLCRLCRKPRR